MRTEDFIDQYNDDALRKFICDQARRHSRIIEDQEDFTQEAWIAISLLPEADKDRDLEYMQVVAYRAIHAAYEKERYSKRRKLVRSFANIDTLPTWLQDTYLEDQREEWKHRQRKHRGSASERKMRIVAKLRDK